MEERVLNKIVDTGLKVDLHIHSALSNHKDGIKVVNNTIGNIGLLIEKLTENEVNICAITDHDAFDYNLYITLKEQEHTDNSIKKVLPGIEFSVQFKTESKAEVIHVVTLFNDNDEEKIKKIDELLKLENNKPDYDSEQAFTEERYLSILRQIDIDTIMIAHQKNSLTTTGKAKKCDVASLGNEKFNEFLFTEYFEAFEFRNKKNEIFNKNYIFNNNVENELRFITGSDCHDWSVYPREEDTGSFNELSFTFVKCLPTFKGLVMAITDYRRIKLVNSFFDPSSFSIDKFDIEIDGTTHQIPLSRGINAIIGDNSIGKSLFLHELTGYGKPCSQAVKKGYKKYLSENNVAINTRIDKDNIFYCDMQGEIRKKFEENSIKGSDFLKEYFPEKIDVQVYESQVKRELERLYEAINSKFIFDEKIQKLPKFKLLESDFASQSLTYVNEVKQQKNKDLDKLLEDLAQLDNMLENILKNKELEPNDLAEIQNFHGLIKTRTVVYNNKKTLLENNNKKINVFNSTFKAFQRKSNRRISDEQKIITSFLQNKSNAVLEIADLVSDKMKISEFNFNINDSQITPNSAAIANYEFVSKLKIDNIGNSYLNDLLKSVLKKKKKISIKEVTKNILKQDIAYFPNDIEDPLEALKIKISEKLTEDFSPKYSIIENGMDKYKELSSGFNSQIYFTIISGEARNKGIYIIDQPEDHVSQKAIREKLLDQFKNMGEIRQVIMVTHNPQFIVNLDIDNVIFLSKEGGGFSIQSGALEYEDSDCNILQLVADNMEGGLDTISRRLKRYEKGI